MRRFCARPSRVSFEATGAKGPRETARRMAGSTPFSVISLTTLAARAPASSQLVG
jgi:hypothetical protein